MEPFTPERDFGEGGNSGLRDTLVDGRESPFDSVMHAEVRTQVELALRDVPEPYRTTLVLRDLEELSYEEIAEVLGCGVGTDSALRVLRALTGGKVRITRSLSAYIEATGAGMGLRVSKAPGKVRNCGAAEHGATEKAQVTR